MDFLRANCCKRLQTTIVSLCRGADLQLVKHWGFKKQEIKKAFQTTTRVFLSHFVSFCLFSFLIRFMFVHAAFSDPPSPGSPRSRNHTLLWIQRATATTRRVANEEALLHAMMAEMGSGREPKDSVMVKY
jgi:hypothetical protein